MSKNALGILILALTFVASCKKDEFVVEREDLLPSDTALIVYHAHYNSHTPTAVNFTVELLQLNGNSSETSYSGLDFIDTAYATDIDLAYTNGTVQPLPNLGSYSTLILFDYNETFFYEENYVGMYLRRFFEIADSLPNRNVALSSMSFEDNTPLRIHSENPGDIFGNSWQYNVAKFYEYTAQTDDEAGSTSGSYLKSKLVSLIDSVALAPQASGDLSITFISGYGGVYFSNLSDIDAIVDKAISNNVKVNIISPANNFDLARIANETGGFYSTRLYDKQFMDLPENQFSNTQITLRNLDELLMGNVTVHRFLVTSTYVMTGTYQSGDHVGFQMNYNGILIEVGFRIP